MLGSLRKCNFIRNQFRCKICRFQHSTAIKNDNENPRKDIDELILKHEKKIIFNSYVDAKFAYIRFNAGKTISEKLRKLEAKNLEPLRSVQPLPVYLKYTENNRDETTKSEKPYNSEDDSQMVQFPYNLTDTKISSQEDILEDSQTVQSASTITGLEVKQRKEIVENEKANWMNAYEGYAEDFDEIDTDDIDNSINYGTPDPQSPISKSPCSGCGALLHCKDTAIPGYIPSEIFKNCQQFGKIELQGVICQRCYFLKEFNTALQVRVSPDEYPKVLEVIKKKRALVLLLVDLLDFPCSVWPGITDIIGHRRPVIVIGNKVDLLPSDSSTYLDRIKTVLTETIKDMGLAKTNISHVSLISALTGWGVEELINKIHNIWGTRGDIYLVGCTNVGKSSLFNALLQSDLCKVTASDLIQRATTSCWPGTTLNLLKFPILRPSGWRLYVRTKRLQSTRRIADREKKLRVDLLKKTKDPIYATLMGHIDRTFAYKDLSQDDEKKDVFALERKPSKESVGINERDPEYILGNWCYDTPGVVQPEQIIHLLTVEELTKTLARKYIRPFSIRIAQNSTVFIGGLARLDYLEGPEKIILTIFRSEHLPITVCAVDDAPELYDTFLGTELLSVPQGNSKRLKEWPGLHAGDNIHLKGIDWNVSCADIVLSNAGWIAVTCGPNQNVVLKPWTPEKRGIYLRKCLLPFAVTLRGEKIRRSVTYKSDRIFAE